MAVVYRTREWKIRPFFRRRFHDNESEHVSVRFCAPRFILHFKWPAPCRAHVEAAFKNFVTEDDGTFLRAIVLFGLRRKLNMIHDTADPLKTSTYREDKAPTSSMASGHLESTGGGGGRSSPRNFSTRLTANFPSIYLSFESSIDAPSIATRGRLHATATDFNYFYRTRWTNRRAIENPRAN